MESDSSSDSDSDSDLGGSSLNASQWNRQRASRPIHRRSDGADGDGNDGGEGSGGVAVDRHLNDLSTKRRCIVSDLPSNEESDGEEGGDVVVATKSDLERAVLTDCLSSHFLWSHLPRTELETLCEAFEKCRYRDSEIIYSQGDDARHVYILYSGEVVRRRDLATLGDEDGSGGEKYTVMGELAVLTGSPHKETASSASNSCILFRLGKTDFHRSLRPIPVVDSDERLTLLRKAIPDEMVRYFTEDDLKDLSSAMTTHSFEAGDTLVKKEDRLSSLVIIANGLVIAKDVSLGGRSYEDQQFGPDSPKLGFGWQSLVSSSSNATPSFKGKMVAQSDGVALMLSKQSFGKVMESHHSNSSTMLEQMASRRLARIELQQIPVFQDSNLDEAQIDGLMNLMHRCEYVPHGDDAIIFQAGDKIDAALYFVREGTVTLETNKGVDSRTIDPGDYFGEANMLKDQSTDGTKHFVIHSPRTAIAHGPRTVVDVLYLEECRAVVDTTMLGLGNASSTREDDVAIAWSNIERHSLLGAGQFGQVWLASIPGPGDDPKAVALKVQSKHQVIESGAVGRVMAERNILSSLKSPFLLRLLHAFQDEDLVCMITSVTRGGELESLIPDDGMCESHAKFYAAGILEGLAYMHRRHLIHRDVKPQNVLIDERGYPVLIDFGFAKYVPDKTFTFVGSPICTAPEIIRFQGHDKGCDYWAWAVLLHRLVTGKYPFYEKGIDELKLYKNICSGRIELDGKMSVDFRTLIISILYPDPKHRLGAGRNGWRDIFRSSWFANDDSFDARKLRTRKAPAPWVPNLSNALDASSFHPKDESETEDLLGREFPAVGERHQQMFASFGPSVWRDRQL